MTPRAAPPPATAGAQTWTGRHWLHTATDVDDQARLHRGYLYARQGAVLSLTLHPATDDQNAYVTATVRGSRSRPYQVDLTCDPLEEDDWDALAESAPPDAQHLAATDPDALVRAYADAAAQEDIYLFPGPDDMDLWCDCPDDGDPCKHGAAVLFALARALDRDPLALLVLLGRSPGDIPAPATARLPQPRSQPAPAAPPGIPAADAYARNPGPLPDIPACDDTPAYPAVLPDDHGLDAASLHLLYADTALRARSLLDELLTRDLDAYVPEDDAAGLSPAADAVRWAATHPLTTGQRRDLRDGIGCTAAELTVCIGAWRNGTHGALDTLTTVWDPPKQEFSNALQSLLAALRAHGRHTSVKINGNRVTCESGIHIRYGRDGRWYPYAADGTTPAGPPHDDPADAFAFLAGRQRPGTTR